MIVDAAQIYLKAGRGGEGSSAMQHLISRKVTGGGGDGGKGGDVIIKVSEHLYDLNKFKGYKEFAAGDGGKGGSNNKKGHDGSNCVVDVPLGTIIRDLDNNVIVDLTEKNGEFLICRGGRGGEGNFRKNYVIPPQDGEQKEVILDYRIPGDAVILGLPNSGKTSLFNKLTGKSFKVAPYPFTTTSCIWARSEYEFRYFTVLDTPPLKKDTAKSGSEDGFLKHLYRAKAVILLSDNASGCLEEFSLLEKHIYNFEPSFLKSKKLFYLLTKIDTIYKTPWIEAGEACPASLKGRRPAKKNPGLGKVIMVSADKDIGIEELKKKITKLK